MEDCSPYTHSPAHLAVISRDHDALRKIISNLPRLAKAGEVNTEEESLAAELKADEVCSVIDRRDVPGRETPIHLAVRLRDPVSTEILMSAGADWSLQNENGWSALQEAVCTREESIAKIIARHYQPLAWAKWCRRLPRIVASASRIRNFYMEITFHFESSVIPFIGRIAPSDTYRIWKRGSNLRADMTLAGFDGFRIQRSDQTFLFLGEGYSSAERNITLPPGTLLVLAHKEKEVTNALEGAGNQPTESEVAHEVKLMSHTNMYRPGIDVTQAELVSHLNWRRQERTEMVGNWKAKVYDMLNVMVSVKSRRVPGAMTDEELFSAEEEKRVNGPGVGGGAKGEYDDLLTVEERKQLDSAIHMSSNNNINDTGLYEEDEQCFQDARESSSDIVVPKEKKGWFGKSMKKSSKMGREKSSDYHRVSSEASRDESVDVKRGKDKNGKKKKKKAAAGLGAGAAGGSEVKTESEYKKGLRPVLWLTPDFPLRTEELLPLLDILADKVKAIRRLRELLTTKLPQGTFPVKVAIPVVPTIRVIVTFTKFEEQEVQQSEEFATPPTSPMHFEDAKSKQEPAVEGSSTSWMSWMRGNNNNNKGGGGGGDDGAVFRDDDVVVVDDDPFNVPSDYVWIDANEKKRRLKAKRAKHRRQQQRKQQQSAAAKNNNRGGEEVVVLRPNGGGGGKEIDSEERRHHHHHRL